MMLCRVVAAAAGSGVGVAVECALGPAAWGGVGEVAGV